MGLFSLGEDPEIQKLADQRSKEQAVVEAATGGLMQMPQSPMQQLIEEDGALKTTGKMMLNVLTGGLLSPLIHPELGNKAAQYKTDLELFKAQEKGLMEAGIEEAQRQSLLADPTREALAKQYDQRFPQIAAAIRAGMDLSEIDNLQSAQTTVVAEDSSVFNTFTGNEDYKNIPENVAPGGIDQDGLKEIWSEEGRWFDDAARFVNPYNDGLATLKRTLDTGKVYYEEKPESVTEEEWNQRKATADQALIFGLMKALDENSVVRESEYATAEAQRPTMEMLPALMAKLERGESLTPEQRKSIISFTKNVGDELAGRRDKEVGRIERVLDRRRGETQKAYKLSDDEADKLFTNVLPALVEYGPNEALSSWLGRPLQQLSEVVVPNHGQRSPTAPPKGLPQEVLEVWDYLDPEAQALWTQS